MIEGGVHDRVGRSCYRTQGVQILKAPKMNLCSQTGERLGAHVRSCEAQDLVPCVDEFWDKRGTDRAGCSGEEDSHSIRSLASNPAMDRQVL